MVPHSRHIQRSYDTYLRVLSNAVLNWGAALGWEFYKVELVVVAHNFKTAFFSHQKAMSSLVRHWFDNPNSGMVLPS